ncbi:hypothetical protein TWF694_010654 [Orbilia ellipsospora]|uniref:HECT-type E3 ubiquitin transferase n=1 Tax=Orbilia ellipsospora TaxID=2528407 RepID=A0AAV9XAL8_9PEZI
MNFTGNTRRPRQVNLSGKSRPSPALSGVSAKNSPSSPAYHSSSTPSTSVAAARESRARRESERQRRAAAIKIQTLYRGYASRSLSRTNARVSWDGFVGYNSTPSPSIACSDDAIALLLLFCNITETTDLERLSFTVSAFKPDTVAACSIDVALQAGGRAGFLITRLSRKVVSALSLFSTRLETPLAQAHTSIFLFFLSRTTAYLPDLVDNSYFNTLADVVQHGFLKYAPSSANPDGGASPLALLQAIVFPLRSSVGSVNHTLRYARFLQAFLSTPSLDLHLFPTIPIQLLYAFLDARQLLQSIGELNFDGLSPEKALWLLSYLAPLLRNPEPVSSREYLSLQHQIFLHPLYQPVNREDSSNLESTFSSLVFAFNSILEAYNGETSQSVDAVTSTFAPTKNLPLRLLSNTRSPQTLNPDAPLSTPDFITHQLDQILGTSLVQRLADLTRLDSFSAPSIFKSNILLQTRDATQNLSLHLLLYFRFLRQKFHNRLFLARSADGVSLISALFSQIQVTRTFLGGVIGTKEIVEGLKLTYSRQSGNLDQRTSEWVTIFLFLDLYCFASVVVDDEEFFSFRDQSLTPAQVQSLVAFLKNLAFATYFEVSELEYQRSREPLLHPLINNEDRMQSHTRADIAGVHGITLPWIRNLVVRILRSLHRRDSRQNFLPSSFWLMPEIDVEGSTLPIAEEESRRQRLDELEEAQDSDSDSDSEDETPHTLSSSFNRFAARKRGKDLKHNYLAAITPRLEILQNLPFLIPFRTRVTIFRDFVKLDQLRRGTGDRELWRLNQMHSLIDHHQNGNAKHHGVIRRDSVFEDAYDEFYALGDGFKEPIQITFVDSFGAEEPGIDGGGILKEFLSSIVQESYRKDPVRGVPFFAETETHSLYPNPDLVDQISYGLYRTGETRSLDIQSSVTHEVGELLKRFEFLGRIIGKCMYEGILVDVTFADFFLLKWSKVGFANEDVGLGVDDLKSLDRTLWKGLQSLKYYDDSTIESLDLTFTVENILQSGDWSAPGGSRSKVAVTELKPNGSQIPVTSWNRLEYIHLLSKYKLVTQGKPQTNAFLKGLSSIISPRWLSMFNQSELQTLVGGNESPLDISDLRRNTVYGGIYTIGDDNREHPTVEMFWRVMERLQERDKRAVLKFVTSVSRAPLLGFSSLNPRFSIRDAGSDPTRLPSTSTCVNLLKLPRYGSERVLEEKLLYAANAGAGFDLS